MSDLVLPKLIRSLLTLREEVHDNSQDDACCGSNEGYLNRGIHFAFLSFTACYRRFQL